MILKELLALNEKSPFGDGSSISDYDKYVKWMKEAMEDCFDKFDEDESQWEKFEHDLVAATSKDQVKVFMAQPSADKMHYNSNGKPDNGKTLEFLENFEQFKRAFKSTLSAQ